MIYLNKVNTYLIVASTLSFIASVDATVNWTATSYTGEPQLEGTAGTWAGFDASGKCLDSNGLALSYKVQNCPFGLAAYFTFNDTKMVLTQALSVIDVSGFIPDCEVVCTNSNSTSSIAYVTLHFYNANNNAPAFNVTFPRYEYVTNGSVGAHILTADAYDVDSDKTTNGNLTWYMVSLDSYSQYFSFYNQSSAVLYAIKTIDWSVGTERVVVLGVRDNPTIGTQMSATVSVTLCWGCPTYTGSSTSSSTTPITTTSLTDSAAFLVPVIVGSILVGVALIAGGIICCCYYCNRDTVSPWETQSVPKFSNDNW